jgi:hypothetical protein
VRPVFLWSFSSNNARVEREWLGERKGGDSGTQAFLKLARRRERWGGGVSMGGVPRDRGEEGVGLARPVGEASLTGGRRLAGMT